MVQAAISGRSIATDNELQKSASSIDGSSSIKLSPEERRRVQSMEQDLRMEKALTREQVQQIKGMVDSVKREGVTAGFPKGALVDPYSLTDKTAQAHGNFHAETFEAAAIERSLREDRGSARKAGNDPKRAQGPREILEPEPTEERESRGHGPRSKEGSRPAQGPAQSKISLVEQLEQEGRISAAVGLHPFAAVRMRNGEDLGSAIINNKIRPGNHEMSVVLVWKDPQGGMKETGFDRFPFTVY
jgi:hypothetical protein